MSREYKFRCWNEKENRYVPWQDLEDYIQLDRRGDFDAELEGYPGDILEQFTGLKDKNGKEIYEGDLVLYKVFPKKGYKQYGGVYKAEVIYELGAFVLDGDAVHEPLYSVFENEGDPDYPEFEVEVIGNIHENPELLEGKK